MNIDYIAGFIDGEGYIGAYKRKEKRSSRGYTIAVRLVITNTNKELIEELNALINGTIIKKPKNVGHKQVYATVIEDLESIRNFLEPLVKHLIIKREQAEIMIKYCNSRLNNYKKDYKDEELELIETLMMLNSRGEK